MESDKAAVISLKSDLAKLQTRQEGHLRCGARMTVLRAGSRQEARGEAGHAWVSRASFIETSLWHGS
jgi:hypothetical protein